MNLSERDNCQRCGATLLAKSTETLCPACLLSGALEPRGGTFETVALNSGEERSLYRPAEFPCLFGDYRLVGLLGQGGMGTVYDAEQLSTGRRVALKMLRQQFDSPEMRQRFLREGRLAARVNHPNSLYIFGSEEIEGLPVITMEVAGGGTLREELKKRGPLPVAEAVDAILDVISGLEAAFAGGVLHRDVKPSNCFVGQDGAVKVGDFGLSVSTLAKTDSFVTAHGLVLGTPAFASPEQLRGDALDVRADIYSVGATLFSLLTDQAPFDGDNAVQVVANAVNQKPKSLTALRKDLPPDLEKVVMRCLAKEPGRRYADYAALRNALLPFSSAVPEPASMKSRSSAGWVDYLIAFLVPYVALMLLAGAEEFHLQPFIDRTLYAWRYHIGLLCFGFTYFAVVEGIWGAGLGKRLKGLRVIRTNGRRPGIGRALIRILVPILSIEVFRISFLLATISVTDISQWRGIDNVLLIGASNVFPWGVVLLTLRARRENGFATAWDLLSGTRVVVVQKGTVRPSIAPVAQLEIPGDEADSMGPYRIRKARVPGTWLEGADPTLRRPVWLLERPAAGFPQARRTIARPGRPRWLQTVGTADSRWEVFEATPGMPFPSLVEGGKPLPWSTLRHWLHDLASELWEATGDETLPAELSLDQVWITTEGRAILLDVPWPAGQSPAEPIPVGDVAGQQLFLNAVAAYVDSTSLPLHARPVLQNLKAGMFERLSFLAGTLRGLLDKPVELSKGIRAGSIFMLPLYVWILVVVGIAHDAHDKQWFDAPGMIALFTGLGVIGVMAVAQLLELPFRSTASHSIFRLAVITADGKPAGIARLWLRWAIVWLPLLVPMGWVMVMRRDLLFVAALMVLLPWLGAAVYAVAHPHRGLHDRLAGTWVVRR